MSTVTSVESVVPDRALRPWRPIFTALEILLVYAGILQYIWRWQFTYPHAWIPLWVIVLLSHVLRRDTLNGLGLGLHELRASAQVVLPLAVALYLPLLLYGAARHRVALIPPDLPTVAAFVGYLVWCIFQQYLTQSYFHNRLMGVVNNRHLRASLVGLMFGSAHIPNPILIIATTLGGFIFAEIFARHRNVWPLALAQAVGGLLIAAVSPPMLIHHMRVGPGYFFFLLR